MVRVVQRRRLICHALAHGLVDKVRGVAIEVVTAVKHGQNRIGHEFRELADGTPGQFRASRQGHLPDSDLPRTFDDPIQRLLPDLGGGIGKKLSDRVLVKGVGDGVGDGAGHVGPPGNGRYGAADAAAFDDLEQVVVAQQRREFENRGADRLFHVAGQTLDDVVRHLGHVLQSLGQRLAHPGKLILGEDFKRFHGQRPYFFTLIYAEMGGQTGNLPC